MLTAALLLAAMLDHPKGYVAPRVATPIVFDGKLDDAAWQDAPWTDPFEDIQGDPLPKPWHTTRAKMMWDDEYLYVGAELEEPHLWATYTEHDSVIFHENDFEVFLDPDGDNHNYFEYEINALGTDWDLRLPKPYRDGGPALNEWEIPGLKKGVHLRGTLNDPTDTDEAWSVELAFPWSAFAETAGVPVPPKAGDQWRINFSRVQWHRTVQEGKYVKVPNKPEENWVWSPQGVIDMHRPELWGIIQFEDSADTPFRPNPDEPVRRWLMRAYHLQKEFQRARGRFAERYEEIPELMSLPQGVLDVKVQREGTGYVMSARFTRPDGSRRLIQVRSDSRLTSTPL